MCWCMHFYSFFSSVIFYFQHFNTGVEFTIVNDKQLCAVQQFNKGNRAGHLNITSADSNQSVPTLFSVHAGFRGLALLGRAVVASPETRV